MSRRDTRPTEVQWEEAWPLAAGLAVGLLSLVFGKGAFVFAEAKGWHVDALYNAIFALTAASSAFLFSLYTYAKTADISALKIIRGSKIFSRASRYIINNVTVCFVTSVLTIPFTVIVPTPKVDGLSLLLFAAWSALSVIALCGSVRSVAHFVAILNAADGSSYKG